MKLKKLYVSKMYDRNSIRYGVDSTSCICCNKPTNEDYFIHMSTDWLAIPANLTDEELIRDGIESQGIFAIGPSCAKKMGSKYIIIA